MIRPEDVFQSLLASRVGKTLGPREIFAPVLWTVPSDLPYFAGHFPQSPILPAIAILDASALYLQNALNKPKMRLRAVSLAKFLSPIVPGQIVEIRFQQQGESDWRVDWSEPSTALTLATLHLKVEVD